jgi:hypothetical protein
MRKQGCAWRGIKYLVIAILAIALLPSVVGLTYALVKCQPWSKVEPPNVEKDPSVQEATKDIPEYARPEDLTYLTLPEWYIVYSTDEYAAFIAQNPPSQFPHFRAVGQYWQSYADVCEVVQGNTLSITSISALGFIGISLRREYVEGL